MIDFYKIIIGLALAALLPQIIKVITESVKSKQFRLSYFFLDGGWPSSHSSFVAALSVGMIITQGLTSMFTLITLALSSIVIRDACGIRLEVGKQKKILEKLDPEDAKKAHLKREGHTMLQIFSGILSGAIIMYLTLIL
jgi:uncharacterized protein